MRLKHITFTGVDVKTDIGALQEIQKKYPLVEWGVLTSYHWYENGNRYLPPALFRMLGESGLNLSLHICGSAAHDAAVGKWGSLVVHTIGHLADFNRIQLNISGRADNPRQVQSTLYEHQELIIQQRNINEKDLFDRTLDAWRPNIAKFSILLDASGGRGVDTPIEVLKGQTKVGYAGGMNPHNVGEKLSYLLSQENDGDFWIDMESGVRTDDWLDLDKVVSVLDTCYELLGL